MLGPAVSGAVTPGRVVRRSRHGPNQNRASQNPQWYGFRRDTRRRGRSHHNVRDRRLVPNRWQSGQRICNGSPRRSGNGMWEGYAAACECSSTTLSHVNVGAQTNGRKLSRRNYSMMAAIDGSNRFRNRRNRSASDSPGHDVTDEPDKWCGPRLGLVGCTQTTRILCGAR
jgi:hypothetical protein